MKKTKPESQKCLHPEGKNHQRFIVLNRNLLKMRLAIMTEKMLKKIYKRFGLGPPNSIRIEQTKDQFSYYIWFENYCINVHSSFNPKLGLNGGFTSTGGYGWVVINENITERVYVQKFKRTNMDSFIKNIINEVAFLINRLEQRPVVKDTEFLYKIKQTDIETVWMNPLDETDTIPFDNGDIPDNLRKHYSALKNSKQYYQNVVRPKKGITTRSRDTRKTWDK